MIADGLLDEVAALKDKYDTSRILNNAIGYKEFKNYNGYNLEEVVDEIKKNSRHYAKRQYTFFNHQMNVTWFDVDFNNFTNTISEVEKFIKK